MKMNWKWLDYTKIRQLQSPEPQNHIPILNVIPNKNSLNTATKLDSRIHLFPSFTACAYINLYWSSIPVQTKDINQQAGLPSVLQIHFTHARMCQCRKWPIQMEWHWLQGSRQKPPAKWRIWVLLAWTKAANLCKHIRAVIFR